MIRNSALYLTLALTATAFQSCDVATTSQSQNQGSTRYIRYEITGLPEIGVFEGVTLFEGGFSSLEVSPFARNEFYVVTDRGPNLKVKNEITKGEEVKLFPLPDYLPKIIKLRFTETEMEYVGGYPIQHPHTGEFIDGTTPQIDGIQNPEKAWVDLQGTEKVKNGNSGFDLEGISVGRNKDLWVCEEYRPSIIRLTGDGTPLAIYSPLYEAEQTDLGSDQNKETLYRPLPEILTKIRTNRGFEGIAVMPGGDVWAALQSPLQNPDKQTGKTTRLNRLIKLNPETGETEMYLYEMNEAHGELRQQDWKIGDIAAVNDSQLLVLEHAEKKNTKSVDVYLVTVHKATPVQDTGKTTPEQWSTAEAALQNGVKPVKKEHLLDMMKHGYSSDYGKAEGLTILNDSTIVVLNDNDYGIALNETQDEVIDSGIRSFVWFVKTPFLLNHSPLITKE